MSFTVDISSYQRLLDHLSVVYPDARKLLILHTSNYSYLQKDSTKLYQIKKSSTHLIC